MLGALQEAGAADQIATLLAQDPATQIALGTFRDISTLLDELHRVEAYHQVDALSERLPAAGLFEKLIHFGDHKELSVLGESPTGVLHLCGHGKACRECVYAEAAIVTA